VDVHADQTFFVERLRQIGVKIHIISANFGEAFAAQEIIGKFLGLPRRVNPVKQTFLHVGARRRNPIDDASRDAAANVRRGCNLQAVDAIQKILTSRRDAENADSRRLKTERAANPPRTMFKAEVARPPYRK
jgi:hypothetical protein